MTGPLHVLADILRADSLGQPVSNDTLTHFLTGQSLSLYGQQGLAKFRSPRFSSEPRSLTLGSFAHVGSISGQRWKCDYKLDDAGLRCTALDYSPAGGEMAGMPFRVCDAIE